MFGSCYCSVMTWSVVVTYVNKYDAVEGGKTSLLGSLGMSPLGIWLDMTCYLKV